MSLEIFYSRAGHLMRRINQIAVAIFLEENAGLDLTTLQYAALKMTQEIPNIDQASLSGMIAIDKTSMVKILDRLVEKGLITRQRSKLDRRSNLLCVTSSGESVLRSADLAMDMIQKRLLAPLGKADQVKFLAMLTKLVHVNNAHSRTPLISNELNAHLIEPKRIRRRQTTESTPSKVLHLAVDPRKKSGR